MHIKLVLERGPLSLKYTAGSIHATTRWLLLPYPQNHRARGSYTVHSGPYSFSDFIFTIEVEHGGVIAGSWTGKYTDARCIGQR